VIYFVVIAPGIVLKSVHNLHRCMDAVGRADDGFVSVAIKQRLFLIAAAVLAAHTNE
jgi:hypothetical protein